jgi:hypothetical protein
VTVWTDLKCHPVSGALLTIDYRSVSPLRRVVKWARIEDTSPPLPFVDPSFLDKVPQREYIKRSPPPLPALDFSEKPLRIDDTPDYRMLAQQELDAGRALEYPNIATWGWLQELPDLPDPTEPEPIEPELPSVPIASEAPIIVQHVPHATTTRLMGRAR